VTSIVLARVALDTATPWQRIGSVEFLSVDLPNKLKT